MKHLSQPATFFLRLALAAGFLSAVASRLGFWGKRSSGWVNFVNYTADVNSFLPRSWAPALAVGSTILETCLGVLLLFGLLTRYAALAAAGLTLLFGLAMALSFGVKEPLDYSVFVCSSSAFLLATTQKKQSI
jgi:putative oxidoreductase